MQVEREYFGFLSYKFIYKFILIIPVANGRITCKKIAWKNNLYGFIHINLNGDEETFSMYLLTNKNLLREIFTKKIFTRDIVKFIRK